MKTDIEGIVVYGLFNKYELSEGTSKDGKAFTRSVATVIVSGAGKDDVLKIKVPENFVPPSRLSPVAWKVKLAHFKEFLSISFVEAL